MDFDIEEPDDSTPAIPGLASDQGTALIEQVGDGGAYGDDWDSSDSEDDLQIVLNDNNNNAVMMMGAERRARMGDDDDDEDEDEEPLVIVTDADQNQPMEEQQLWGGEEAVEGDGKEGGEAVKGSATGQAKAGYNSSHGYHHPFHSQFKVSVNGNNVVVMAFLKNFIDFKYIYISIVLVHKSS